MSAIPFPETLDSPADLQIWNNAVFDKSGEISGDPAAGRDSWGSLKSIFENPKSSFDSDAGKENDQCLVPENGSIEPLNARDESRTEGVSEKGFDENVEKKIDEEIVGVQCQISKLKSRLEALRLEKYRMSVKSVERGVRAVPAKFMDSTKVLRRGISLGPAEIISGGERRGEMSMGPTEKQQMITPVQSRRISCVWKLEDIDETRAVTKERGKRCSLSPESRKVTTTSRRAVTTIATKKTFPVIHSVQPKKLFGEGENKPSLRLGRVVASRYNEGSARNKCPLSIKKQPVGNGNLGSDVRVKKRWEIPSEIVVHGSVVTGEAKSICHERDLLPKIKVARCTRESPRDSGPAKRVVELIGRKSFFRNYDLDLVPSVCQALAYAEEDEGLELSGVELSFPVHR